MEYLSRIFVTNISGEYFGKNAIKKKKKVVNLLHLLRRGVGVESGGDLWVLRVIKYNIIYFKCLLLALLLALSIALAF